MTSDEKKTNLRLMRRRYAELTDMFLGPAFRRTARPFDEDRALELLCAGMPTYKVRLEGGAGNVRSIVRIARSNGIALRRRTDAELRL